MRFCLLTLLATIVPFAALADPMPNEVVGVPHGTFIMGDGLAHCGENQHQVTLSRDFYLGKHEVTNQEYRDAVQWAYDHGYVTATSSSVTDNLDETTQLLLRMNDSYCQISFADGAFFVGEGKEDFPVSEVTWYGGARFCDWLSLQNGLARAYAHSGDWLCNGGDPYGAEGYRLPTDAEWEYAAQYTDERAYPWGSEEPTCDYANYDPNAAPTCHGAATQVGGHLPGSSGLGFWDMGGNVWEWCNDWHVCDLGTEPVTDPPGPSSTGRKVVHGGNWYYNEDEMLCAHRNSYICNPGPHARIGLRVARTAVTSQQSAIIGAVRDPFANAGISGASVVVRDDQSRATYSAITDTDGDFTIHVPGNSDYTCEVTHLGYLDTGLLQIPYLVSGDTYRFEPGHAGPIEMETNTVVLVHGVLSSAEAWTAPSGNFLQAITAAGYHVPSPISLVPSSTQWFLGDRGGVKRQAQELGHHLDALSAEGIKSVMIVAHSMGGLVSRQYIRSHPNRVKTLVMLGTPNHGSELAWLVEAIKLLAAAKLCPSNPLGCAAIYDLINDYIGPAFEDLSPGSDLLGDLNYDDEFPALPNFLCLPHPDETTLGSETKYYTYAGTAWQWPGLGFDLCYPPGWGWLKYTITGDLLFLETLCGGSDSVVPENSVPLMVHNTPTNVVNYSDSDWGCGSSHAREECPPMLTDPCVVEAVDSMLRDEMPAHQIPSMPDDSREDPDPASLIALDWLPIEPGGARETHAFAGTADSLGFEVNLMLGSLDFSLVDPGGRAITPDTAAADPDIDYYTDEYSMRYLVRSGLPGEWTLLADASASPDSVVVCLSSAEYSEARMQATLAHSEIIPGDEQLVEVTLTSAGVPILAATVAGTVTDPEEMLTDLVFLDDGTGGDLVPDDGIYTTEISGNPAVGQYSVDIHAQGVYGEDRVLNRSASRRYFAAQRPDLELLPDGVELTPTAVDTALYINVSATFANVGTAAAESVVVEFLEGDTYLVFADSLLLEVAAGEELTISADWPARGGLPERSLGARVIVQGSPAEFNLLNNEAYGVILLADVADDEDRSVNDWRRPADYSGPAPRMNVSPNPLTRGTTIRYELESAGEIELGVFDVTGRRVRLLDGGHKVPGVHSVAWDGRDNGGVAVAGGVYFATLRLNGQREVRQLILLR